jgi:hypothetical protein
LGSALAPTHLRRDRPLGRSALGQADDRALVVVVIAVLAELALGLEARDPELEADDRPGLRVDVARRRIVDRPGDSTGGLVALDQPTDVRDEPFGLVVQDDRAAGVDRA